MRRQNKFKIKLPYHFRACFHFRGKTSSEEVLITQGGGLHCYIHPILDIKPKKIASIMNFHFFSISTLLTTKRFAHFHIKIKQIKLMQKNAEFENHLYEVKLKVIQVVHSEKT